MPEDGEPLWLKEDSDAVLEYLREEALRCPGCGLPRDETMRKESEGLFRARVLRCHACAAKGRREAQFAQRPHEPEGLYLSVERLKGS